jgi:ABC-type sugar transport system permease subunit
MYEAATIDGANARNQFRYITLPMLLVALSPLLVASFGFNFNNFTVIELFNNGGPPMSAATVAGHTDILLSYTYRLAFAGSTGVDYGFAAAVSIFIFMIVAPLTYFNFRLTRRFEEVNA